MIRAVFAACLSPVVGPAVDHGGNPARPYQHVVDLVPGAPVVVESCLKVAPRVSEASIAYHKAVGRCEICQTVPIGMKVSEFLIFFTYIFVLNYSTFLLNYLSCSLLITNRTFLTLTNALIGAPDLTMCSNSSCIKQPAPYQQSIFSFYVIIRLQQAQLEPRAN